MPSEPTPTTPAQRAALHALTEQAQALGLGYDRPSAPTTDAPPDALAAIRARHARDERLTRWVRPDEMHADRAALLAAVERLTTERDDARREAMKWNVVADRVADEIARLRRDTGASHE